MQKYSKSQLNKQWWEKVVKRLKSAKADNINNINSEMIEQWRDNQIENYSNVKQENYEYIKPSFLVLVTNLIIDILKENNIIQE